MTNEQLSQDETLKIIQKMLRSEEIDYANDSIYGAAILLDSYLNDDLTVEEALQEFIDNSDIKLGVKYE